MSTEPLFDPETAEEPPAPLSAATQDHLLKEPRFFMGIRYQPWRITSFTSLTANQDHAKAHRYDPSDPLQEGFGTGIFGFARGARAGNCLHEIFERIPFNQYETEQAQAVIQTTLMRYDLAEPQRHLTAIDPQREVNQLLTRVLRAPLPGTTFALADVAQTDQLKEWPFHVPLEQFQPGDFQSCLQRFGHEHIRQAYAPLLNNLKAERRWEGFLTGIIDLCFTHGGRWYLLDWKSNDLGPNASHYNEASLWQSMCDHHYVFQYHLYTLALHRFLASRLPDYQYEQHMGGVFYAFLRGIEGHGQRGWYVDLPDAALIEAMNQCCEGGSF